MINGFLGAGLCAFTAGLLGLGRDHLIAGQFGVTFHTDAFYLALGYVLFFAGLFTSLGNSVLVPRFAHDTTATGIHEALVLNGVMGLVAALAFILVMGVIPYDGTLYAVYLVPVIVLAALYAVGAARAQAQGRYLSVQALSVLPPLISVLVLILMAETPDLYEVAGAFVIGYGAMTVLVLWRSGITLPRIVPNVGAIKQFVLDYRWMALGLALMSANTIIDQTMALWLTEPGGVTILTYGGRFVNFATATFVSAVSGFLVARFVTLDAAQALTLRKRAVLFLAMIGSLGAIILIVLAPFLMGLVFGHGEVTQDMFAKILEAHMIYAVQIPFFMVGCVFAYWLNAQKRNRLLARVSAENVLINITGNAILGTLFGTGGIAAATVLTYAYSCIRLYGIIRKA